MSISATININAAVGGVAFSGTVVREDDGQVAESYDLPAAFAGTLTTRGSDTAGTVTLAEGHGITTGATFDLYWSGGRRINVTAGTVSDATHVPFSLGTGDNLPALTTAVTASLLTEIMLAFDADLLTMIAAHCPTDAHVGFFVAAANELDVDIDANEAWLWWSGNGFTNPLAGHSVTSIQASQADATARTFTLVGLMNNA